jgi:hypothetical protein
MWKYDKEELAQLILEQNRSYSSIGKMYGVSGAAIKKAAKRFGIPLPRRRVVNESEKFSHPKRRNNTKVNSISDDVFVDIVKNSHTWKEAGQKMGYSNALSNNVKDAIVERCSKLGVECGLIQRDVPLNKTKGELFSERKNWQSARSAITKLARGLYFLNNPSPKCAICGYSHHVEIAHIKAVSEFDDTTPVREINSLDNLIALCPNHHWEYDHGVLML